MEREDNHEPRHNYRLRRELRKIAAENGAIGSRLMGAGRGGFLVVYCDDNKEHAVANKLEEAGTRVSPFAFDFDGMQVWETNK